MKDIKNNWCLIPPSIWKHSRLSITEKCLLGRINSLSGEKGYCYAGNNYLAEELGFKTPKALSNAISKLVAKGFLIREVTRTRGKEIEERRLKISWVGIESSYQGKVDIVEDTPLHQIMDTSPLNDVYPIHLKVEEREDVREDNRIDINTPKVRKKVHNEKQEHLEILHHYNMLFRPDRPSKDKKWYANADEWLKDYSVEDIKDAISNWHNYPHWSKNDGKTPPLALLFRTRNKNGEANYIDELLGLGETKKRSTKSKEDLEFEKMWEEAL